MNTTVANAAGTPAPYSSRHVAATLRMRRYTGLRVLHTMLGSASMVRKPSREVQSKGSRLLRMTTAQGRGGGGG